MELSRTLIVGQYLVQFFVSTGIQNEYPAPIDSQTVGIPRHSISQAIICSISGA